jgi:hypothetical protein
MYDGYTTDGMVALWEYASLRTGDSMFSYSSTALHLLLSRLQHCDVFHPFFGGSSLFHLATAQHDCWY